MTVQPTFILSLAMSYTRVRNADQYYRAMIRAVGTLLIPSVTGVAFPSDGCIARAVKHIMLSCLYL